MAQMCVLSVVFLFLRYVVFQHLLCKQHGDDRAQRESEEQPVCEGEIKRSREVQRQADRYGCDEYERQCIRQVSYRGQQAVEQDTQRLVDEGSLERERICKDEQ